MDGDRRAFLSAGEQQQQRARPPARDRARVDADDGVPRGVLAACGALSLVLASGLVLLQLRHTGFPDDSGDGPDLYAALGLDGGSSTEADIKRSYRKLSRELHPDHNPSDSARKQYQQVQSAYAVLSDRKRRKVYDIMGHRGLSALEEQERRGGRPRHPFEMWAGDNSRGPDQRFDLRVSLADVYNGAEHTVPNDKWALKDRTTVRRCQRCQEQPPVIEHVRVGGGFIMQQQRPPDCERQCGQRGNVVRQAARLTTVVERGVPEGHELKYEMEADEYPDRLPGDFIMTVESAPHPVFTRRGDDLEMAVEVSLVEAVSGFTRVFQHLDGHSFEVSRPARQPTAHGTVITLPGEGMPRHGVPSEFGDLEVTVKVRWPRRVGAEQAAALRRLLGGLQPAAAPEPAEDED
eukprot:TRINITY_DN36738_c0_g1_i1.p2 TRINITY_DN36738_c0_g1~~TRINITY_DN36738_c0_g1_i1.p2  ORF type:complete len:406 (+),score=135.80 TRINITY_DN36738_c0_g1_i1:137-1354(+)